MNLFDPSDSIYLSHRVSPRLLVSLHCKRNITHRQESCTLGYVWFSLLTLPHRLHTNLCYLLDCTYLNTLMPRYLSYKLTAHVLTFRKLLSFRSGISRFFFFCGYTAF